ncbi:MAG: type I methionyl aminopeptidase [Crocinitomicaceae bacterium]|jgi:methionyl aminopeptidase|nr:type I methionyl aminopeptidase [Crocinitomicaceae bacterium]
MSFGRRVHIKTDEEVELLRESSLLVGKTLAAVADRIKPGVTTLELDAVAEEFIRDHGGEPGFKGYGGFPNSLCTSVNEAVVHGIPNDKPLVDGDIVSVDCGVLKNEFYGDSAYTFAVGEIAPEVQQLLEVTKECLQKAIEQAIVGKRIGDIGFACQHHAEQHGYGVVRELVGHGLGRSLHEAPEVPNYGRRGNGPRLMDGMVLAIEPMINLGRKEVFHEEDGWTIVTADRKVSAHFEHDIVVRKDQADVLSSFDEIEKVLQQQKRKV